MYNPIPLKYLEKGTGPGQVLVYNDLTQKWEVKTFTLNDLDQISISSPSVGETLIYNSSGEFVNSPSALKSYDEFIEAFGYGQVDGQDFEIYLDPLGDDVAGDGTSANPFQSLAKASEVLYGNNVIFSNFMMRPNIILAPGVYNINQELYFNNTGDAGFNIKAQDPLDKPIIDINLPMATGTEHAIRLLGTGVFNVSNLEFRTPDVAGSQIAPIKCRARYCQIFDCGAIRSDEINYGQFPYFIHANNNAYVYIKDAYTVDNGTNRALDRLVLAERGSRAMTHDVASVTTANEPFHATYFAEIANIGTLPSFDSVGNYYLVASIGIIRDANGDKVN